MRRGFMGMMLKRRCDRRSGCGKGLLDQKKKSKDDSVKDQSDVFFEWKALSIMNLYHVVRL